jgi:hypothetical protein
MHHIFLLSKRGKTETETKLQIDVCVTAKSFQFLRNDISISINNVINR